MKFISLVAYLFILSAFISCKSAKDLTYFNNVTETPNSDSIVRSVYRNNESVIQPNDILSINVSSLNQEASKMFNTANEASPVATAANTLTSGYLVNQAGTIQFPMLGQIKISGLTKGELNQMLIRMLKEKQLLVDPIITIRYMNFRFSVIGEVTHPGVYTVPIERISLLEALSMAGDLTIYGKRNNLLLIRENGDSAKIYKRIDLTTKDILSSPYYYLQSNDVLYIETSKNRVSAEKRSTILPIIFSLISLLIVIIDRS